MRVAERGLRPMADDEELTGTVERVVYHDERTRYTVMRVHAPGHDTLVTAVGRLSGIDPGLDVILRGHWDSHPTHGRQFAVSGMRVEVPTTNAGIERRLRRYPGVKAVMAARIVARFGADTLSILDTQPRRLLEVDGIGKKTFDRVMAHHQMHSGPIAQLEAQLLELELPAYLAESVHERYGADSIAVLKREPYRLAREVRGIGFTIADRIARAQGLALDSPDRLDAGVMHVLEQAELDGHCALPIEALVHDAAQALSASYDDVRASGERLVGLGELVLEHGNDGVGLCFSAQMILVERDVADALVRLSANERPTWKVPPQPEHLSEGQVAAVHAVAEHGVVVLTGGPGTGKSTVVREIIELAKANNMLLQLAAPTGRAAKRLEQTTGEKASTIHRLLEFQPETGRFTHGLADPLETALLVIDESSMVDIHLAQALFNALTPAHRVLLVGDADQLPSVGPGNVLRDIMNIAEDPDSPLELVRLKEVFRQAEGSSIVHNAYRILSGQMPVADPAGEGGEFFVVPARDAEHAHELVLRIATERIPEAYGIDAAVDVQVLTPMHKGQAGTEALNRSLQAHHTAGAAKVELRGGQGPPRKYCKGDRVMQIRNDYDKGVFNGDVGWVAKVDADGPSLSVDFDGNRVRYEGREIGALALAYAVSIHKSQGSEFEAVIVTLLPEHHVMLRRNLLYTAVTRARRLCVVVGNLKAIARAVQRADDNHRHTALARRLREALGLKVAQPA